MDLFTLYLLSLKSSGGGSSEELQQIIPLLNTYLDTELETDSDITEVESQIRSVAKDIEDYEEKIEGIITLLNTNFDLNLESDAEIEDFEVVVDNISDDLTVSQDALSDNITVLNNLFDLDLTVDSTSQEISAAIQEKIAEGAASSESDDNIEYYYTVMDNLYNDNTEE